MSQEDLSKRLSVTITNPQIARLIRQYAADLGLEPAQVVALAMKRKLQPLGTTNGGAAY